MQMKHTKLTLKRDCGLKCLHAMPADGSVQHGLQLASYQRELKWTCHRCSFNHALIKACGGWMTLHACDLIDDYTNLPISPQNVPANQKLTYHPTPKLRIHSTHTDLQLQTTFIFLNVTPACKTDEKLKMVYCYSSSMLDCT